MKLLAIALAASSVVAPNQAPATETNKALELRPKVLMVATPSSAAHASAPFVSPTNAEPQLSFAQPHALPQTRSACGADQSLCYDSNSGHLVYKPAREFMPELPGLHAESISLKRNRLVFRYSF